MTGSSIFLPWILFLFCLPLIPFPLYRPTSSHACQIHFVTSCWRMKASYTYCKPAVLGYGWQIIIFISQASSWIVIMQQLSTQTEEIFKTHWVTASKDRDGRWQEVRCKYRLAEFQGQAPHKVSPFKGKRYSLVFYFSRQMEDLFKACDPEDACRSVQCGQAMQASSSQTAWKLISTSAALPHQ